MKITFKWLACFFVLSLFAPRAGADETDISADSWKQYPGEIALAIILKDHSVIAHVKNNSKNLKMLLSQGPNIFVLLFYLNDQGSQVLVSSLSDPARYDDIQKNPSSLTIEPGGEISKRIEISTVERTLLKTHPATCTIIVYDSVTKTQSKIESTPKLLTSSP